MLGSLFLAKQRGYLDEADTYIGCSIGGILLGLMNCGWTPFEILEHSCQTTLFKDFTDIQWTQITKEYGLFPNSSFEDNLAKKLDWMIRKKWGRIPTLEDMYEITGKRMIFVVVSLKEERLMYMDYKNAPHMDLLRVMRMTSNMPGIFGKLEHQKDLFVDGACLDPFPINYLDDGNTPILGIAVDDVHSWDVEKIGPMAYFDRIATLPLRKMMNTSIANASEQCVTIVIPVKDDLTIPILDNGKNVDIRIKMFQRGYRYTERFFDTFGERGLKKTRKGGVGNIRIDESVVRGCLKSQSVQILLQCARENFGLLTKCMTTDDLEALFGIKDGKMVERVGKGELEKKGDQGAVGAAERKESTVVSSSEGTMGRDKPGTLSGGGPHVTVDGDSNEAKKDDKGKEEEFDGIGETYKGKIETRTKTQAKTCSAIVPARQTYRNPTAEDRNMAPQRLSQEEEEEILEIPRSAFRPVPGFNPDLNSSFPDFFPRNNFLTTPIIIEMKIDREMIDAMMEMGAFFLTEILRPRLAGSSPGTLRKF